MFYQTVAARSNAKPRKGGLSADFWYGSGDSCYFGDYISYKIPNRLMLYAAFSIAGGIITEAVWMNTCSPGMIADIPARMIVMLIILIPVYLVHAVGAGDIKLMCVMASVTGVKRACVIFAVALVISALYGIPVLIRRRGCGMHRIHFSYAILAALIMSILSTQIIW